MTEGRSDKQQPDSPAPRRGRATPLGVEAGLSGQAAFVRAGFADPTLVLRWEEIAGAETAALAQPVRLGEGPSGGVLTLRAEPGAALFLQHDSRALCERINAYLGRPAVARLRFIQGPVPRRSKPQMKHVVAPPVPPSDPARKYQGPEGLRDALLRLARSRRTNP
jgi:hypothetical protein